MKSSMRALLGLCMLSAFIASAAPAPIAGGYTPVENENDANVQGAFDAAKVALTEELGSPPDSVDLISAESQVVAGTNYKLTMAAKINGENTQLWEAVVFQSLPSSNGNTTYEVTSLEEKSKTRPYIAPPVAAVTSPSPEKETTTAPTETATPAAAAGAAVSSVRVFGSLFAAAAVMVALA